MKLPYLLILTLFSISASAQQLDRQAMHSEDVQHAMPAHQYQTLLAGETEFTVVVNDSTTVNTRGMAVLVNDLGLGHMGDQSLEPLVQYLNEAGWATVLMSAPQTEFYPAKDTTDTPDADAQQPADTSAPQLKPGTFQSLLTRDQFDQQERKLQQQLMAVAPLNQQYPGFVLVISQGTSAAWLTKLYAEGTLNAPDALITIAPFWPDSEWNYQLSQYVSDLPSPLLDIYNAWNNDWTLHSRKQRQVAAKKALKLHYRQREIIGQSMALNQSAYVAKEILGWLTQMGW